MCHRMEHADLVNITEIEHNIHKKWIVIQIVNKVLMHNETKATNNSSKERVVNWISKVIRVKIWENKSNEQWKKNYKKCEKKTACIFLDSFNVKSLDSRHSTTTIFLCNMIFSIYLQTHLTNKIEF